MMVLKNAPYLATLMKNMVIFGTITRQYFQKCKLAGVFELFFREMTLRLFFFQENEKSQFLATLKMKNLGKNTWI